MTEHLAAKSYEFRNLLFFLLIYLFVSPFIAAKPSLTILAHFLLSIALFFAVFAVQKQQHQRSLAMVLLVPVLVLYWLGLYRQISFIRDGSYALLAVYFILLIISFGAQLMRAKTVTLNLIFATLCLYLVIGLLWGSLYALLYQMNPDSFAGSLLENPLDLLVTFNYFSMVTLTTLGYGDITPQTAGAGALCQMEAITGQFFTAVVVAWLVGNFVTEKQRNKNQQ